MKLILVALVLISATTLANAKPRGFFVEPIAKTSSIGSAPAYWAGLHAGILLNEHFAVGAAFNSLMSRQDARQSCVDYSGPDQTLSIAYAGAVLSYTGTIGYGWHGGFDFLIGDGWRGWEYASAPYYFSPPERTRFFAIEPIIHMEADIVRPLRITGGLGYLYAKDQPAWFKHSEFGGMMYSVGLKYLTM